MIHVTSHARRRIGVALFWLLAIIGPAAFADQANTNEPVEPSLDVKIAKLIQQLGSDSYATRQKAQGELERLGLVAFDALHEAQDDDDIEVAMRSRYLVRSMRVNWAQDEDSAEVKRILRGYAEQHEAERKNRMERLAALDNGEGVAALCRLVRFEASDKLSKQAALLVITRGEPTNPAEKDAVQKAVETTIGLSKRPGADWLKAYSETLDDAVASLAKWEELTKTEHEMFTQFPERSSREIVRDLLRWHAGLLDRHGQQDEAVAVMRQTIDLVDGTREQILETVDWLMKRQAWSIVEEMATRYSNKFEEDPLLLYRYAEAQLQQGQMESATKTGERALRLTPDEPDAHVVMAYTLQEGGLMHWAESEYLHAIKLSPSGSLNDLRSRLLLSEMLHDLGRELPAAEALQGAVDAMEKDPSVAETVRNSFGREPGSIQSRMHYFYAMHHASDGDVKQTRSRLQEGIKSDPTDADVLIAMHRLAGADDEWRAETKKRIDTAIGFFRDEIAKYEREAEQAPSEQLRMYALRNLASANNQFAWLVSNTVGDYEEAIRCSKKSLELRPDTGGYYDTLGRCYYANGDYANAVKCQRRAVELEPFSGQIQRQLELFEKALQERQN